MLREKIGRARSEALEWRYGALADAAGAVARARDVAAAAQHSTHLAVPLTAQGRTLGVMTFVTDADHPYRDEDLVFAQDPGRHVAVLLARGVTVA
ncbi:MAG: GAF domain-containing protein [Candidatus Rokubacteria bacterium]|nr:GAF domain-containing protein [Candidatus Rokubacteria bacterium]